MPRQKRFNKTIKNHSRTPVIPGPVKCSPLAVSRNANETCLPVSELSRIAKTLRKYGGAKSSIDSSNRNYIELANELGCNKNDGKCIIQKSLLSQREKKLLLDAFFRPDMPSNWKHNPDTWLTSEDIANVMKQYEQAFPEFRFIGVVPIDFSAPDPYQQGGTLKVEIWKPTQKCMNNEFCEINLQEEKAKGRRILGAVFNLDPHYKGGSHWVALAIDLKHNCVYYFDSYGMPPPKQVARFMRYLTLQNPNLKLQSNGRRFQYSNTECGMYSMYFLIRMIAGESFKKFCKNPIKDKWMIQFRKVLFNPNTTD